MRWMGLALSCMDRSRPKWEQHCFIKTGTYIFPAVNRLLFYVYLLILLVIIRVSDPYSFDTDPNPGPDLAFQAEYRSGTGSNPDRIQGFDDQKLKKIYSWKKNSLSKTTIYLSLGLHKGRPSYRRSLQLSEENIQHFKTWNFLIFSYFVGYFCPPGYGSELGSDPDPLTWLNPDPKRIRIRNPGHN